MICNCCGRVSVTEDTFGLPEAYSRFQYFSGWCCVVSSLFFIGALALLVIR